MNETETSVNAERLECGDFSAAFGRGVMTFIVRRFGLRRHSDSDDGAFEGDRLMGRLLSFQRQSGVALRLPPHSIRFATQLPLKHPHRAL